MLRWCQVSTLLLPCIDLGQNGQFRAILPGPEHRICQVAVGDRPAVLEDRRLQLLVDPVLPELLVERILCFAVGETPDEHLILLLDSPLFLPPCADVRPSGLIGPLGRIHAG